MMADGQDRLNKLFSSAKSTEAQGPCESPSKPTSLPAMWIMCKPMTFEMRNQQIYEEVLGLISRTKNTARP